MQNKLMALESNQRFYDAFNKNDLDLMREAWLNDPASKCIHPGWDVLTGFKPIIESWRRIFSTWQNLEIKLSHVEVTLSEDLAWVTCQENLFSISTSGVQLSKVHATNLFKQVDGEWKMVLHHASPVGGMPTEEQVTENWQIGANFFLIPYQPGLAFQFSRLFYGDIHGLMVTILEYGLISK